MCISVLTLVSLILFLACGTVKVKRPCLFIHFYTCIGIIFLLFYSCWQTITRMLPNQYANASVTITALLGLWCRRRVPQTGMIFYPCLRCVLLAPESLMCISSLTCALRRSIVLQFFWHIDTRPISPFLFFFNSTFYLCIIIVIFTWCIWCINWSCWQSYITLSVLMF